MVLHHLAEDHESGNINHQNSAKIGSKPQKTFGADARHKKTVVLNVLTSEFLRFLLKA